MKKIGIYKLTNKCNNKIYIGKSVDIVRRISRHKHSMKSKKTTSILDKAIKKYGWDNFEVLIIEEFETSDGLLEKEAEWIRMLDSTNPNIGYNICEYSSDFTGKKHSDETKRKLSEINTGKHVGELNHMYGKTHSKEAREKISNANKDNFGKNNPFYGRTHSVESMRKMIETKKSSNGFKKGYPVFQIDITTGIILKEWSSSKVAATEVWENVSRSKGINNCCNGNKPSGQFLGFKWVYKKDYIQ